MRVEDWDDVKEGVPEVFLEEWPDSSGAVRRKVVIPGNAIVYVLPG